jgi:hypothetical protein
MTTLFGRRGGLRMSRFEVTRRELGLLLLTLPAVAPARGEEEKAKRPSPEARFIAAQEPGLSTVEREALERSISRFEKSLSAVRDFKLPPDVPPAVRFAALKSTQR